MPSARALALRVEPPAGFRAAKPPNDPYRNSRQTLPGLANSQGHPCGAALTTTGQPKLERTRANYFLPQRPKNSYRLT